MTRRERLRKKGLVMGPLVHFVRGKQCCACRQHPGEPHHVRALGMGTRNYDWLLCRNQYHEVVDMVGNVAPLCHACHRLLHDQLGKEAFEAEWDVDLALQAQAYGVVFKRQNRDAWNQILDVA